MKHVRIYGFLFMTVSLFASPTFAALTNPSQSVNTRVQGDDHSNQMGKSKSCPFRDGVALHADTNSRIADASFAKKKATK